MPLRTVPLPVIFTHTLFYVFYSGRWHTYPAGVYYTLTTTAGDGIHFMYFTYVLHTIMYGHYIRCTFPMRTLYYIKHNPSRKQN